ncbi:MAG: hypothetical protein CTY35_14530 [Methylotenera sp.]|nr:MAG: hypothetical protein CTY35_14530 [Methylotenera sp.]
MSNDCTEERFLKDVSTHQMKILRDDGVNRHIRFSRPNTSCCHFDLITWTGKLCYTGDMGTYVFARIEDMFEFFRSDRKYGKSKGRNLSINLGYWSEKLLAVDGGRSGGSVQEFDEGAFNKVVMNYLLEWIKEHRDSTTKEDRRDLWDAVISEVINADGDTGGMRKQIAGHDFHHTVNSKHEFYFQDLREYNTESYTYHFIWCCYALAWGIEQYDKELELLAV